MNAPLTDPTQLPCPAQEGSTHHLIPWTMYSRGRKVGTAMVCLYCEVSESDLRAAAATLPEGWSIPEVAEPWRLPEVKEIVGSRFPAKDRPSQFKFDPDMKLFLSTGHVPKVAEGQSFWRRLRDKS